MTVGAVVLTQGRRPTELAAALESLAIQRDVELDIVVVGNGWEPSGLPDGVHSVGLEIDRGIPAGRNAGVGAVDGELLFFLDDDARLAAPDALARVAARFDGGPRARDAAAPRAARPTAGRRRATGCRGCGSATRRARAT